MNHIGDEQKMTVKEVAAALQCAENTILNAIRKFFPEVIQNGKITYLNSVQVTAIKLEIQGHHNLASTCELPKTQLEKQLLIQQAMILQSEMIEELSKENFELKAINEEMLPKAITHDALLRSSQEMSLTAALKYFGIPPIKVGLPYLREQHYLTRENLPTMKAISAGFMRQRITECQDGGFRPQAIVESGMLVKWHNALVPNMKKSCENQGGIK